MQQQLSRLRMNVILDCERMKYSHTGLFHYCLNLGLHLPDFFNGSTDELCYFFPKQLPRYFGNDANYLDQYSFRKFMLPSLSQYDIWHATYQNTQYLPKKNKKIRVVLSIHDLNFVYEKRNQRKQQNYLNHLQANIDRSDVIICISQFSKNDVLKHCHVNGKKIRVIHNGTNMLDKPLLAATSYEPVRPFLFSIGVISPKKNFNSLFPLIQQSNDLELVIAGRVNDNEYYAYLLRQAEAMKISDRVHIVTDINEQEKSWYYNNCYAFIMPSIAEGFGLPVVEAMSVGKPTFLSQNTALPEIGGDEAFYFHDFEAESMKQVFENGMTRYKSQNMEEAIKKRSTLFNWAKAAGEYYDVYKSLM